MEKVKFNWTPEKEYKVKTLIENFIIDNSIYSSESVMQTDSGNEESINTMCEILDVINPVYEDDDE